MNKTSIVAQILIHKLTLCYDMTERNMYDMTASAALSQLDDRYIMFHLLNS